VFNRQHNRQVVNIVVLVLLPIVSAILWSSGVSFYAFFTTWLPGFNFGGGPKTGRAWKIFRKNGRARAKKSTGRAAIFRPVQGSTGLGTRNFYFQDRKNLKFQDIFQDISLTKTRFVVISGAYNFRTFRAEAKITKAT